MSLTLPHVNWFGGAVTIPTFIPGQGTTWEEFLGLAVEQIHLSGGVASYNHPFGASNPSSALSQSVLDTAMTGLAKKLLRNKALGTDMLEVRHASDRRPRPSAGQNGRDPSGTTSQAHTLRLIPKTGGPALLHLTSLPGLVRRGYTTRRTGARRCRQGSGGCVRRVAGSDSPRSRSPVRRCIPPRPKL